MLKKRSANFDLLRITAMFFVLTIHINLNINIFKTDEVVQKPLTYFIMYLNSGFSVTCVNIFVLLSGWFGISFKKNKIISLISQVLFFSILIYLCHLGYTKHFLLSDLSTILLLNTNDYWFIKAYIGLYLLSPIINKFIVNSSESQILKQVVVLIILQTIYGWLSINGANWIAGGFSVFSFIILYLIGRYFRLFYSIKDKRSFGFYFSLFIITGLVNAIIGFFLTYLGFNVSGRLFTYTNPVVIAQSICLLLAFSKIKLESRFISWISVSCLSVYLLHANELILRPIYGKIISTWFYNDLFILFILKTILFIIVVFCLAILLDKTRLAFSKRIRKII